MAASLLTFPVLGLQDRRQLARGNPSGHLASHLSLALLAGDVERCVPVAVLQLQAGPFLHQLPHHERQVQVGGQVQRTLHVTQQKPAACSQLRGSSESAELMLSLIQE